MTIQLKGNLTRRAFIDTSLKTLTAAGVVCVFPKCSYAANLPGRQFDIIIKNGTIHDGTLRQPFVADIAVSNDRIAAIGSISGSAKKIIDAEGLAVTPGFIDVHTHCDLSFKNSGLKRYLAYVMPSWKGNYNYLFQGVTTVVTGNCGYGYTDTEQWFDIVNCVGFGTNVFHLTPHGMLREELFGSNQPRQLNASQMGAMKNRIDEEMAKGAMGMSSGLEYAPGFMASSQELIELSRVVRNHGGIYTTHMRDESGRITSNGTPAILSSILEAVETCRQAEIPVEISHLKITEPISDTRAEQVLDLIESARMEGLPVTADQYPYAAGSTYITILLPDVMKTSNGIKDEYKTKNGRKDVQRAIEKVFEYLPPEKTLITMYGGKESYEGKTIKDIADMENRAPSEAFVDMACEEPVPIGVFFSQDMDIVREIMPKDYIITASDGWTVPKGVTKPHPRVYGAFPRKLKKFAMDENVLDINRAIRSMTSFPAEKFNMKGRGKLAESNFADIAVINLNNVADRATYKDPHQYSEGVVHLFVNGTHTIENGKATGDRGGMPLKRT